MLFELVETDLCVPPVFLAGERAEFGMDRVAECNFEHVEAAPERSGHFNVPGVEPQCRVLVTVAGAHVGGETVSVEQSG